jgi:Ca-activated chloride channel family protein
MYRLFFLFVCLSHVLSAQITEPRQKAINNYIQLANHLTSEMQSLGPSLVRYHHEMEQYRKKPGWPIPEYLCKLDAKAYYYEEALKTAAALGTNGTVLASKTEALRTSFQEIDETCKAIEIYFRLKDYETDQFKKFEELISAIEGQVKEYSNRVHDLQLEVDKLSAAMQPYNATLPYHRADKLMRDQLAFEKSLLDSWSFNVNEAVHTGWPHEAAQKHVLEGIKEN